MSTASPRPQLSLDEMRRLKWLLGGCMALIALWTVFFLDVEALPLVVLASALTVAAMAWPQLPARIPLLVWRLSVPAIVLVVVADLSFSPDTLPSLIRLAVLLVLYRAVSYRRKREDLQLLVLSLFLIVVAGVLTVSLGFAFLLLLFTAGALGFLFCVTLIDMADDGPKVMRPEELREVPAWAQLPWLRFYRRLRLVADWRLLGFAAGLFVLVVGFSALLFTLIPRFDVGSGFFLDKYITRKSRTGFSEIVKFGQVADLIRDESIAMRVDLAGSAGLREPPYLRLVVLDEYNPEGFRMSLDLRKKLTLTQRERQVVDGRRGTAPGTHVMEGSWTFYVEPEISRFLPLPGSFGSLRLRERMPLEVDHGLRIVALRSESMAMIAYQLEGVALEEEVVDAAFARAWRTGQGRSTEGRFLGRGPVGPENEAVLQRVLAEITRGEKLDSREFVRRATEWLQARHSYALSVHIPSGKPDAIVKWLDSNEPGFCEYFAAALAVLSRAAGYPARVVAGFHGGTMNAFENYYMVKNSDAHAWVEVFDGRQAWFRTDPTPGATRGANASAAAAATAAASDSSWSARFDSLRVLWYRRIVSFDSRAQVELMSDVKNMTTETGANLRRRLESYWKTVREWMAGPWDKVRIVRVLQLCAGLIIMVWALARAWHWTRLGWRMWREPGRFDPVRSEAGEWLGTLRGQGREAIGPDAAAAEVEQDLLRLRYGHRASWPEPKEVFRRARRIRRHLVKD